MAQWRAARIAHGMFHDTLLQAELLLPNGTAILASPSQHPELFHAIGGSYGTLCLLTAATVECVPAAPYVRIDLRWFDDVDEG